MINKLFGTLTAKIAVVALAGGFATGGLAAAGAFTGHADSAHESSTAAATLTHAGLGSTTTATVGDREDHKATATVEAEPEVNDSPEATPTVTPEPTPTETAEPKDSDDGDVSGTVESDDADDAAGASATNHGNCVSFAASIASTLGLSGEQKGAFVSAVAKDKTAVTLKVATGGTPDAACVLALATAKTSALATPVTGTAGDHGNDGTSDSTDDHTKGNGDTASSTTNATRSGKGGDQMGGHD